MKADIITFDGGERRRDGTQGRDFRPGAARRSCFAHGGLSARQAPLGHAHREGSQPRCAVRRTRSCAKRARAARVTATRRRRNSAVAARRMARSMRSHAKRTSRRKCASLALMHALSAKAKAAEILVLDAAKLSEPKTKNLFAAFLEARARFGARSSMAARSTPNFRLAARNIPRGLMCCRRKASMFTTSCAARSWCLTKAAVARSGGAARMTDEKPKRR